MPSLAPNFRPKQMKFDTDPHHRRLQIFFDLSPLKGRRLGLISYHLTPFQADLHTVLCNLHSQQNIVSPPPTFFSPSLQCVHTDSTKHIHLSLFFCVYTQQTTTSLDTVHEYTIDWASDVVYPVYKR